MKNRIAWFIAALSATCLTLVSYAASDAIRGNFVAQKQEPEFSPVKYSDLPGTIRMIVRVSSQDIIESVQARYPTLRSERSHVSLEDDELVSSRGKFFRRVRLYNRDLDTRTYHGTCGQWIAVWFYPNGAEQGVYVDEPACPL
jgi:hypothetical protein